jgi:hypothetical protein
MVQNPRALKKPSTLRTAPVQRYGKKLHECMDNTHALQTYVAPSKNRTEERKSVNLPNSRCISFSSISLVLFILLKLTYPPPPPRALPLPHPQMRSHRHRSPPTLVEAWLAYKLLPNSTGTWVHGAPQVRTRRQRHSPPHMWLRGLCAYCCHTTLVQSCLEQIWLS